MLVIKSGERQFGLVVDEMVGEQELVIKALDDQSIATDLVSGASILGDGRVVLILNMIALMERFSGERGGEADGTTAASLLSNLEAGGRRRRKNRSTPPAEGGHDCSGEVLVVDDSALMRKLIPKILERDASIKVVGTAMTAISA